LLNGYNGDSCYTFSVGEVNPEVRKLLKTTKAALYKGIEQAVAGNHVGDISFAVQQCCEAEGYSVVRELTGHGIGRQMHEDPPIPNYGRKGEGILLKAGMCIAIEPMVTMGERKIAWLLPDKWGIITQIIRSLLTLNILSLFAGEELRFCLLLTVLNKSVGE
jgi:methionyl aminopeptidase